MGEKETFIASAIDAAGAKAQYDEHVRQILKDKNISAVAADGCRVYSG